MRVLFIARATLYTNRGGDTIQALATCKYLLQLGVDVTVKLCNEEINYESFDLIHFFNVIRPADILIHIKRSRKPYVISTVYLDYSQFERKARRGLAGFFLRSFNKDFIEYAKAVGRSVMNKEKILSKSYLVTGHRASVKYILKNAAMLLPNSESEYRRLLKDYRIKNAYQVIPNGLDEGVFHYAQNEKEKDLVLCVARIEPFKNQLNLIRALNGTNYRLVIIGAPSTNHRSYYNQCRRAAGKNVQFINILPQQELVNYYQRAKVHVLASWFETTGLSSLEAAAMGCSIVITDKGDAKEYFTDIGFYCEPDSVDSIKAAVDRAASADCNCQLKQYIHEHYTWMIAAKKTLEAYNNVLSNQI